MNTLSSKAYIGGVVSCGGKSPRKISGRERKGVKRFDVACFNATRIYLAIDASRHNGRKCRSREMAFCLFIPPRRSKRNGERTRTHSSAPTVVASGEIVKKRKKKKYTASSLRSGLEIVSTAAEVFLLLYVSFPSSTPRDVFFFSG